MRLWSMLEKRLRTWLYGDHAGSDYRARRASHDLANEVTKLQAEMRIIRQSSDPWQEFVKAVRGCEDHRGVRH